MEKIRADFGVYKMPRSGTTYFMNMINEVFVSPNGGPIRNGHDYPKGLKKAVGVYRDFRDVLASHWRIRQAKYDENSNIINKMDSNIDRQIDTIFKRIQVLEDFQKDYPDCLLIKYEDFWDSPMFIFDRLEEYLNVKIPIELKEHAIEKYSLPNSKKISDSLGNDFDNIDKDTDLHGKHIYTGKPGTWLELISKDFHKYVTEKLRVPLEKYGYIEPRDITNYKNRKHDIEGRDILRSICIGNGIDVGCANRPITDSVDTLDINDNFDTTYTASILDMPIEDDKYDFLIASHVLEHVDNTIRALKEFRRVIRVGGKVGIMVPHGEYVSYIDLGDSAMTHRVLFSEKTLEKYLLHVGFKSVKINRLERPLASGNVPAIIAIAEK